VNQSKKIVFANQLRGLAALSVVVAHLTSVFWKARVAVAAFIGAPVLTLGAPSIANWSTTSYLNTGVLGVAVFFIISGFVIPLSLVRHTRAQFVIGRLLRIYPTYFIGLGVGLAAVWVSCRYWHHSFIWDANTVLQNLLLINSMTGVTTVDLVNWTLAIELKFYVLALMLSVYIRRGAVWPLIAVAAAILAANRISVTRLGTEMLFVSFMFIGVLFNYRLRGCIGGQKFVLTTLALMAFFFAGWSASPWPTDFWKIAPNYAYAVLCFAIAYRFRDSFRNLVILDFFADISYPLYITHSLVGYTVMRIMFEYGIEFRYVMPVTAAITILVAYAIHVLVERPSMQLFKTIYSGERKPIHRPSPDARAE
jgi:peptidoglycan/LPS O-acetylase OafA/YrhL